MAASDDLVTRFAALYAGLTRAYGTYRARPEDEDGEKVKGEARTWRETVSEEHYRHHIEGKLGLGIIPIRDDATCLWGAIDIDDYTLDLPALERKIRKLKLPLIVCRTKSGGAHLYLFCKVPVQAKLVRRRLTEWAYALGQGSVEIFPKQESLGGPDDVGNWINLPYFDAERTVRYAVVGGKAVDLEAFIKLAEASRVDVEQLKKLRKTVEKTEEAFDGAPPCLRVLVKTGFPEGSRNNGLFNLAVYARKRWGDHEFEGKLQEWNQARFTPPLSPQEVRNIVRSASRKTYNYLCDQEPIQSYCSQDLCMQCRYGIHAEEQAVDRLFEGLTKITSDPPTWWANIAGQRVQFDSSADLTSQRVFLLKCYEATGHWPQPIKADAWRALVNKKSAEQDIVEAPRDAGTNGMLMYHLNEFTSGDVRPLAREEDEILMGKPWENPEDSRVYFRAADLLKYLQQEGFRELATSHKVYAALRKSNAVEKHFRHIKGKGTNLWSVVKPDVQLEEHTIPRVDTRGEF